MDKVRVSSSRLLEASTLPGQEVVDSLSSKITSEYTIATTAKRHQTRMIETPVNAKSFLGVSWKKKVLKKKEGQKRKRIFF